MRFNYLSASLFNKAQEDFNLKKIIIIDDMACHRVPVMAPGPGRTALRAASLPCGDEAAGGSWAQAEPARAGADCRGGARPTLAAGTKPCTRGLPLRAPAPASAWSFRLLHAEIERDL